jgi:predicted aminopeptidase
MEPPVPEFNNDHLITPAGDLNLPYIAASAKRRAASAGGAANPSDVKYWEEKLTGMATMLRTRWRRDRGIPDPNSDVNASQHLAVAALIGQCEAIAASGNLAEPAEQSLRLLIVETCNAFGMPTQAERVAA